MTFPDFVFACGVLIHLKALFGVHCVGFSLHTVSIFPVVHITLGSVSFSSFSFFILENSFISPLSLSSGCYLLLSVHFFRVSPPWLWVDCHMLFFLVMMCPIFNHSDLITPSIVAFSSMPYYCFFVSMVTNLCIVLLLLIL